MTRSSPETEADAPGAGEQLRGLPDRYRLLGLQGAGRQKRVYRARDAQADRDVVIARLDASGIATRDLDAYQEIAALARLGVHPHVLGALQVIAAESELYLVLPFMPGGDVAALLDAAPDRRLGIARALELGAQLCSALEHAHRHGVVHGDVKPGNLLLDGEGRLQLADFGLARLGAERAQGPLAGTLAYLSPEQIRGEAATPASDLYALGCVLYELLTGAPPFVSESPAELMSLHQLGRPRDVQGRRPAVPVSLSLIVDKLLEKDPAERPASVAQVHAALAGALRAFLALGGDAAHPPHLVARETELGQLAEAVADARDGRGRVVLVSGEAGIGKSSLIARAAASAGQAGSLVLYGLCGDDRALPHRPIVDALLPLAARLSELPAEHAARLREFLYLAPDAGPRHALSERGVDEQRLFVSIFTALAAFSQQRPIVLILEDLHQADSASLDLFEYLAWAIGERAERERLELLLVGSFREVDSERLGRLVDAVHAIPRGERIGLPPLRENATVEVLRAQGLDNPSRQLAEELCRASRGNPLFLREILRHLQTESAFEEKGGATVSRRPVDAFGLPQTVIDAVARRIEGIGPKALDTLRLAALLGAEFELRSLDELAASPLGERLADLDEAVASGLLFDDGRRFRFTHPLVREVMAAGLTPDDRGRTHRTLADYWLAARDHEPRIRELEIARHLMQAGRLAGAAELGRHAGRAADHALAKFAWSEAADFLQAALDALKSEPVSAKRDLLRAELHRKAGFAHFRRLDPGPCLHHYEQAAALFRAHGDRERHALTLNDRTRALVWLGMNDLSGPADVEPLRAALEELADEARPLRAEILSTLAEHAWSTSDAAAAEAYAVAALELTDPDRDHLLRAEISINLGLARQHALRVEEALATLRLGAVHGRRAGDLSSTARCLQRVHLALYVSGRLDDALRACDEVAGMNRVLQLAGEAAITSGVRASVAAVRGDYEAVERHAGEALELVRRAKYPWAMALSAPVLACARALRGDAAGAHRAIDLLVDPEITFSDSSQFAGMAYTNRWLVEHYVGNPLRISAAERDLLAESVAKAKPDAIGLSAACLAVEVADACQEARIAALARPLIERAEQHGGVLTAGWPFFLPRLLGLAAMLEGRFELAEQKLESAVSLAARLEALPELGRSRLDLARMLALRNAGGDRARALAEARAARVELARSGDNVFVSRAEKLCAYLGG